MFGSDGSPIVQYVVIFAVIFTALAAIVFVVRRLTGRGLALPGRGGGRGRQPRLGIVDVYELDRARQLILLRRDNVEHLLLVGGPNDVVVERNIQRGQRPLPEASLRPAEPMAEPLPDPLAGAGRLPEPQRSVPEIAGRRSEPLFEPGFEMPVVVPSPVPGSGAAPPVTLPLDAGLIGGDEPGQDLPAVVRGATARGTSAEPGAKAPSAREPFSARRILRRTLPPILDPRPEPASERVRGGGDPGRSEADRSEAPVEAAPRMPPPLAVPGERRAIDPAVLSDMARQLQAALARPSSAVGSAPAVPTPSPKPADPRPAAPPPPAPTASAEPRPAFPPAPPVVDPVAAAMAAPASERSEPPPSPAASAPSPAPSPEAARPVEPLAAQAQPPAPSEPTPLPAPATEKAAGNPFSVEEIEAEFARLLGRPLDKRS